MLVRSRVVLPVTAPPLEDGAVWLSGGRVRQVGRWRDLRREVGGRALDAGESVLFPGLVNAHCHLDYTGLAGCLPPPRSFAGWIKSILSAKAGWGFSEFAASWLDGARQLLSTGTTTVANIESVPEMLADVRDATPLRVYSFLEMTGIRSGRSPGEILDEAESRLAPLPVRRGGLGLSPHAPYSTHPGLLSQAAARAEAHGWRITTHVAESQEEFDMYMYRRGPLFDWLAPQRDMSDCGLGSPVRHLERVGMLRPGLLAVHVNHLWSDDARRLAAAGVSVVHCPRSHRYFQHRRFPRQELEDAGVTLAVGTDSLASTRADRGTRPILSLLHELAALAAVDSAVAPDTLLTLATASGARVLGLDGLAGTLSPGAWADMAWLPHAGRLEDAAAAVVHHPGEMSGVILEGRQEWPRPARQADAPPA